MRDVKTYFHWIDHDDGLQFGSAEEFPVEHKHEKNGEDYVLASDYDQLMAQNNALRKHIENLGQVINRAENLLRKDVLYPTFKPETYTMGFIKPVVDRPAESEGGEHD